MAATKDARTGPDPDSGNELPDDLDLLDPKATAAGIGIGLSTLYGEVRERKFKPPIKIGSKSFWLRRDVREHIRKLAAQRDTARVA